jgi:RNA polymerase sigma factor (sigma-70 family)
MVWGVCRRVLRNYHDAEDAFQVTFLVLVRRAASVVPREMVANWLYGVAHQTALKARATAARRKGRERQVTEMPEPAAEQEPWRDLQPLLDQELSRLPDKYRAVVVLCDLEGKTRKEAARQLGVPEGTVAGRLARARTMLANRLVRRGLTLSGGLLAVVLAQNAAAAGVPASVASSTITAASLVAAGEATAAGVISARVAALTEGVLKAMLPNKLTGVLVALVLVGAALVGGTSYLMPTQAAEKRTELVIPINTGQEKKPEGDEFNKAILAAEARLWEAGIKGDAEAMKKIYADDFRAFSERGRSDKEANVEATKTYHTVSPKFRNVEIVRLNKDAAIITYRVDMDAATADGTVAVRVRDSRMSNGWALRDGRWVLVFSQMTQMPQGDPGRLHWGPVRFRPSAPPQQPRQ